MQKPRKIIVAVTGASGVRYASILMEELRNYHSLLEEVAVIFSDNAAALPIGK